MSVYDYSFMFLSSHYPQISRVEKYMIFWRSHGLKFVSHNQNMVLYS